MTVTKVEDYINGRYKIDIDGAFAFVLYKGELRRYQIKEGELLSGEAYREIMESVLPKRAKLRAMHLLKVSDRTEADVRRRLKDGCYPEQAIDEAIIYLKSYHYIDDR
ncbi:MAG TPA: regulatory protein RecX, partial [Lachnospiraceae bacterium]|nr:regulatory protein RecX [Lachnospiraceae bacterium]